MGMDSEGKILSWTIGHGLRLYTIPDIQRALHVRELTPEQRKLSITFLRSHPAMLKAIEDGWTPERHEEINVAARRRAKEGGEKRGPSVSEQPECIDHYLYFPKKIQAEIAARRLKVKGWAVVVRMGADGENWLVLAKQPTPIDRDLEEIREELEHLAEELDGEYDGWGAPVSD
jgi:sirohydrochlorin ferrochelatase